MIMTPLFLTQKRMVNPKLLVKVWKNSILLFDTFTGKAFLASLPVKYSVTSLRQKTISLSDISFLMYAYCFKLLQFSGRNFPKWLKSV